MFMTYLCDDIGDQSTPFVILIRRRRWYPRVNYYIRYIMTCPLFGSPNDFAKIEIIISSCVCRDDFPPHIPNSNLYCIIEGECHEDSNQKQARLGRNRLWVRFLAVSEIISHVHWAYELGSLRGSLHMAWVLKKDFFRVRTMQCMRGASPWLPNYISCRMMNPFAWWEPEGKISSHFPFTYAFTMQDWKNRPGLGRTRETKQAYPHFRKVSNPGCSNHTYVMTCLTFVSGCVSCILSEELCPSALESNYERTLHASFCFVAHSSCYFNSRPVN